MLAPLPLAEPYARFRDAVWDGVAEPTRLPGFAEPLSELEIQSLWFAGAFGQQFTGTEGESVRVVDFGVWNSGAGPDFTGCTVAVHGETRHGDIELDPDVRDWERHGHGGNPDYNGVVLHVFLSRPEERFFTRTQQHRHRIGGRQPRARQVKRHDRQAREHRMPMGVDQPGHQRAAAAVDDPGALRGAGGRVLGGVDRQGARRRRAVVAGARIDGADRAGRIGAGVGALAGAGVGNEQGTPNRRAAR